MIEKALAIINSLLGWLERDWAASSNRMRLLKYLAIYTLVFSITFFVAYSPLLRAGVSLIWTDDGRKQFFPLLLYVGRYWKGLVAQFSAGNFSMPLYDLSIGVGDGVISFPASLCYSNPLYMLGAALLPLKYLEYFYNFMSIFLVYLAGLTFSYMCRYYGKPARHVLLGSIIYCFCGYAVFENVINPIYFNAILTLPLLIVGTEEVLQGKSSFLFIFSVMWTALSASFYFLYMNTIVIAVYALVRFWRIYAMFGYKRFFLLFTKVALRYILGLCLCGVIFFPSIAGFFESGRMGHSAFNGLYPLRYYFFRLMHLISPPGGHDYMAFAAIVLPALLLLFMATGRKTLKVLVIIAFAFFMLSPLGLLMNGFQYPSNRWIYALMLVISYTVVEVFPEIENADGRQKLACLLLVGGYLGIVFLCGIAWTVPNYFEVGTAFLGLTAMTILIGPSVWGRLDISYKDNLTKYGKYVLLFFIVLINIGFCEMFTLPKERSRFLNHLSPVGMETKLVDNLIEREMLPYFQGKLEGRVDSSNLLKNGTLAWGVPSLLPSYNALLNKFVCEHWLKMEGEYGVTSFRINSTGQRTIQNTLLSQIYHVEPVGKTAYVPYGYSLLERTPRGNLVFKNNYALPWGYTYDKAVPYGSMEHMNGVQKQELMLQAIALESGSHQLDDDKIKFDAIRLPYQLSYENSMWKEGQLNITKEHAKIVLLSTLPANSEAYVRIVGLKVNSGPVFGFTASTNSVTKIASVQPRNSDYYYGRENYLFNLGYSNLERHNVTISFPFRGNFKLKDIELYALPMTNYPARVNALRAEPMKNIQWGTNKLSGSVDLSKDKILCVSVPYSKGWSATVDGQEAEILRGNYMFMALPLKAGHHDIVFSYCPPGLKLGLILTVLSWAFFIAMLFRDKRKVA